ncbi:MAG: hypothetical protein ACKVUS_01685 [Saprospiraceae bacterium]
MSSLTVHIPDTLESQLQLKAKEMNLNIDSLVEKALQDFFYFERLNHLRGRLNRHFKLQGIESEEDIYRLVS